MTNWTYTDLAHKLGPNPPIRKGDSFMCYCPSHNDPTPSLHVSEGRDGGVVVACQAKCDKAVVWPACVAVMGGKKPTRSASAVIPSQRTKLVQVTPMPMPQEIRHRDLGLPSRTWEYRDAAGALHFIICRFETPNGKEFRPYTYKSNTDTGRIAYSWTGPDRGRIMYGLDKLATTGTVCVVEGEKAADAARILLPELSTVAACGGAKNWRHTNWEPIAGRPVLLWPDNDEPGIAAFDALAEHLERLNCQILYARNVAAAVTKCHTPQDKIKGFDAADAVLLNWGHSETIAFLDAAKCESASAACESASSKCESATDPHKTGAENCESACENANPQCESAEIVQIRNANPQPECKSAADSHFQNANPQEIGADPHGGNADSQSNDANPHEFAAIAGANPHLVNANPQESLAAALKSQAETNLPFLALGFNQDSYYYLSRTTKQVKCVTTANHKENYLKSIHPSPTFWVSFSRSMKDKPEWGMAVSRMMEMCHDAGLFTPDLIRGRGAWFDAGHVVLHLGNRLIVDGVSAEILTRPGNFVYELSPPMDGPGTDAMTDAESNALLDLCRLFSWERDISALYLAGWVALAPVCGALDWRPHIWITGAKGTGKSTIEDRFLHPLLGNMVMVAQGNSTEAGIRQTLCHDAIPVIIDESESQDERGRQRMEGIMEMMRQASTNTAARTIKGGATGKATTYYIRSMFCLASIGAPIRRAADQSRITKLSLRRSSPEHWPVLDKALTAVTHDTSRRLIARTVQLIPVIRHNAKLIAGQIAKIVGDQRLGDQYGALLAGAESLQHSRMITVAEAKDIATRHAAEFTKQANDIEHDEFQCLEHLLQQIIRCDRKNGGCVTLSVAELIEMAARGIPTTLDQDEAAGVLKRHGMRVDPITSESGGNVKIARTHSQLATLFKGTPWQSNGWAQFFLRLPGAKVPTSKNGNEVKIRFGGQSGQNAVELPLTLMEDEQEPAPVFAVDQPNF